jgi:undecaprenyl-diphosphatase
METIIHLDQQLFLFLNSLHAPWLDPIVYVLTQTWFWIPLYGIVLYFIIRKFKKMSLIPIVALLVAILVSDQTCNIIKRTTERPRPSRELSLQDQIHLYQKSDGTFYKGGVFGYPSAHAANSMVFALFIIFFLSKRRKWIMISALIWSLSMGYTRIYLGVHYPLDVLSGFTLGFILAYPLFRFVEKWVQ